MHPCNPTHRCISPLVTRGDLKPANKSTKGVNLSCVPNQGNTDLTDLTSSPISLSTTSSLTAAPYGKHQPISFKLSCVVGPPHSEENLVVRTSPEEIKKELSSRSSHNKAIEDHVTEIPPPLLPAPLYSVRHHTGLRTRSVNKNQTAAKTVQSGWLTSLMSIKLWSSVKTKPGASSNKKSINKACDSPVERHQNTIAEASYGARSTYPATASPILPVAMMPVYAKVERIESGPISGVAAPVGGKSSPVNTLKSPRQLKGTGHLREISKDLERVTQSPNNGNSNNDCKLSPTSGSARALPGRDGEMSTPLPASKLVSKTESTSEGSLCAEPCNAGFEPPTFLRLEHNVAKNAHRENDNQEKQIGKRAADMVSHWLNKQPSVASRGETPLSSDLDVRVQAGAVKLISKIGSGSFGLVYRGVLLDSGVHVAVKLEDVHRKSPHLVYECRLYHHLLSCSSETCPVPVSSIPRVYWYGVEGDYAVMVMELLGPSLEDIFNFCRRRFSVTTTLMLADQMTAALDYVHKRGIIHRDLKPHNFTMGRNFHDRRTVYIIDFGLAKRYLDPVNKQHIPMRHGKSLTGTARFVSVSTHLGSEQSRRDDIESLAYILVYFVRGSLPWQGLRAANKKDKYEVIMEKKMTTKIETLCAGLPSCFTHILQHARCLKFPEPPDYSGIRSTLRASLVQCAALMHSNKPLTFDWEAFSVSNLKQAPATSQQSTEAGQNTTSPVAIDRDPDSEMQVQALAHTSPVTPAATKIGKKKKQRS